MKTAIFIDFSCDGCGDGQSALHDMVKTEQAFSKMAVSQAGDLGYTHGTYEAANERGS